MIFGDLTTPSLAGHSLPHHRVLLLNSYHSGYEWSEDIENAIRMELTRAENTLDFSVEYLDAKRFDFELISSAMEAFLLAKYRNHQPDVLIVSDNDALEFILARRALLFPGVPVVFCGINNYNDDLINGQTQITGLAQNLDMGGTIELILRLHPQVKQIAFISDSSATGQANLLQFRQSIAPFRDQVDFVEVADLTHAELKSALQQLPANCVILATVMARDRDGVVLSPQDGVALITVNTELPFYGMVEHAIGDRGVGGIMTSADVQGETAALMTLQILRGTAPEEIPVLHNSPTRPIFNYPMLQRYSIDENMLPSGSLVRSRSSTFWRDYPVTTLLAGLALLMFIVLTILLLATLVKKRKALRRLKARKNELQQVVESMPVGVCLADRNGRIFMVNSAAEQIWGGQSDVSINDYAIFKGWWTDSGRPLAPTDWGMTRAIRNGETSLDELIDIEDFHGQRKTIRHSAMPLRDDRNSIIGGLVVIQDITEHLRSERTLQALANEWQNTFDSLTDAIILLDKEFRIMHCNQAFLQMVQKEPQSIVGLHCWELVHYSDSPVHNCPFARMLESGQRETTQQQLNGRWLEVHVEPIFDDYGKLYGAIHIIADITERKLAELDRQALISQLEDRNTELEQFAYSVSHDLKTPLVTIGGFVGQLKDDLARGDRDSVAIDLDFIESSAAQMGTLLNNVLHLARSGRIINEPCPIDLRCIIQEALLLTTGLLDSSMTRIELAEDLPQVYGDLDRLREVFQNLIDNAVKFSQMRMNPEIAIGGRLEGNQVVCWVRDNGAGIPPQYLEKIFGLFERLNHSSQGTGIGLALARRIVEKHGGKIWAESAGEGQGSCFYLTLPI